MKSLAQLSAQLCEASEKKYVNPYEYLEWPQTLDRERWYTSPELVSLHGTGTWDALDEPARKRLSFFEAVNFFSLNIHGEKSLVEGLARRLYAKGGEDHSAYLHHFLDEENKHMVYFGGFCSRYAGKVYRDRKVAFPREYAEGEEDFLFFAKVLIFEEIVDVYNLRMSKDERLEPIARRINLIHHLEETRHLAFGRAITAELFERHAPRWGAETRRSVSEYLVAYLRATWKEYWNPDVYADAGLEDPYGNARTAFEHPGRVALRREIAGPCVRYLLEHGMIEAEPAP
ncbi:MAG: diiron oxygenase [Planctomycetota bacterium]